MARRRRKKRSKFQILTIVMAWLMAAITLIAVIAEVFQAMVSNGWIN